MRDRCFVCVLLVFMLFIIGGGIWAIYPVVFSISNFCGIFHCCIAAILSVATISTYCLAAFRSPGAPPIIPWGSYPAVGKGGLEDYTFCQYCLKPKSPSAHHCRSCGMCVLDMDHHCPFIGNCVGAGNHRSFILFLISAVVSTMYVSIISAYVALQMWPSIDNSPLVVLNASSSNGLILRALKEMVLTFFTSIQFLSIRGFLLVYLFIASISVEIGIGVLLWQQLCYIYEGKTYLSQLSSQGNDDIGERDCQNLIRFFGCPHSTSRYLPSIWNSRKSHKK